MLTIAGLELGWLAAAGDATVVDGVLTMTAGPTTDWFNNPSSGDLANPERVANAPALVAAIDGDFQLSATVTVDFEATFDAGVLFVHQTADDWAKLCFEFDPTGQPMVVTVVTRGVSDDSNEPAVDGRMVHQRVSRFGGALAFHYSLDGSNWKLSRLFALRAVTQELRVGFLAQSPTGAGCVARFSDVCFARTTLLDARDGS